MATFHVIYDPTDRIQVGPPDRLPAGVKFIAMKCEQPPEKPEIGATVGALTRLLLERL